MTDAPGAIGAGYRNRPGYALEDGSGCLTVGVHLTLPCKSCWTAGCISRAFPLARDEAAPDRRPRGTRRSKFLDRHGADADRCRAPSRSRAAAECMRADRALATQLRTFGSASTGSPERALCDFAPHLATAATYQDVDYPEWGGVPHPQFAFLRV
jgi:hypothetical protein